MDLANPAGALQTVGLSQQVVLADLKGDPDAPWIYVEALVRTIRRSNPHATFLMMWFAHGLDHDDNTTTFRNTQQRQSPVRAPSPAWRGSTQLPALQWGGWVGVCAQRGRMYTAESSALALGVVKIQSGKAAPRKQTPRLKQDWILK
jgi:hypothetical protein